MPTSKETLKKGCLRELTILAGVLVCYHLILRFGFEVRGGALWWGMLGLGVFGFLVVSTSFRMLVPPPEVRAIVEAERGAAPRDGCPSAVRGTVVPLGDLLESPFRGTPCCAYEYAIRRPDTDAEGSPVDVNLFRGFACAPCAVRSRSGEIALRGLGFGSLELPPQADPSARETRAAAERFVRATTFTPEPVTDLRSLKHALGEWFDPAAAEGRWDFGRKGTAIQDGDRFRETALTPGTMVTAIGAFSRMHGALVSGGTTPLRLTTEDLSGLRAKIRRGVVSAWVLAVVMAGVSHGIFAFLHTRGALR